MPFQHGAGVRADGSRLLPSLPRVPAGTTPRHCSSRGRTAGRPRRKETCLGGSGSRDTDRYCSAMCGELYPHPGEGHPPRHGLATCPPRCWPIPAMVPLCSQSPFPYQFRGLSGTGASSPTAAARPAPFSRSLQSNSRAPALHRGTADDAAPPAMLLQLCLPPPASSHAIPTPGAGPVLPAWLGSPGSPARVSRAVGPDGQSVLLLGAELPTPASAQAEQDAALGTRMAQHQHALGRAGSDGFGA